MADEACVGCAFEIELFESEVDFSLPLVYLLFFQTFAESITVLFLIPDKQGFVIIVNRGRSLFGGFL